MVKRFITVFFLVLLSLVLTMSAKADPINMQDSEISGCFDEANNFWNAGLDATEYNKRLFDCLSKVDSNHTSWNCNSTSQDTAVCANEYATSVCQGVNERKQDNWRVNEFFLRCDEKRAEYINLFTSKRTTQVRCPVAYQGEIDAVKAGSYDEDIEQCSSINLQGCINGMQEVVLNAINEAESNACMNYTPDSSLQTSFATEVKVRFDIAFPTDEEVKAPRDYITAIIDTCQQTGGRGNYSNGNQLRCTDYIDCIIDELRIIPYDNAVWTCKSSFGSCEETFAQGIGQFYRAWVSNFLRDNPDLRNTTFEDLNCTDTTLAAGFVGSAGDMQNRLTREIMDSDLYEVKFQERSEGINAGEEVDEADGIFPTDHTGESLLETFQDYNCGFAGVEGKNACCIPEEVNIDLSTLNQTSNYVQDCFIPNPLDQADGCWITDEDVMTPLLNFVIGDLGPTTNDLNAFLNENGGIPKCFVGVDRASTYDTSDCKCVIPDGAQLCRRYIAQNDKANDDEWNSYKPYFNCVECMKDNGKEGFNLKFYTAIGCIDTSVSGISEFIFGIGIGISGLIALFCIIFSAFQMQTSQGNPEQIQKAQQNITSCITGLILIIFSIFILRVIGVDILRIPGFSSSGSVQNEETETPQGAEPTAVVPTTLAVGQGSNPTPTSVLLPTATTVPTPTSQVNTTNKVTRLYIDVSTNYEVPANYTILNVLAASPDNKWLQVQIEPLPPYASNTGYMLRSDVNTVVMSTLPSLNIPEWLP